MSQIKKSTSKPFSKSITTKPTSTISKKYSTPITATLSRPDLAVSSSKILNCLVHGEPTDCYFTITAKNNDTVEKVKRLIIDKTDFGGITARLLRLWTVDEPFVSTNLGDPNVDILVTLNGHRFLPPSKVGDVFNTQPAEDHVQIIVELPISTEDRKVEIMRQAFDAFAIRNEAHNNTLNNISQTFTLATQQLIERKTENHTASLSQTELDDKFRLPIVAVDINDIRPNLTGKENVQDINENQQANDTMVDNEIYNYLKRNIRVPSRSNFYDTKSKKSLLSLKYDVLPFEISGTTDVVIAKKSNANGRAYGIQAGFELKDETQDSNVHDLIEEEICDLKIKRALRFPSDFQSFQLDNNYYS